MKKFQIKIGFLFEGYDYSLSLKQRKPFTAIKLTTKNLSFKTAKLKILLNFEMTTIDCVVRKNFTNIFVIN